MKIPITCVACEDVADEPPYGAFIAVLDLGNGDLVTIALCRECKEYFCL